MSSWPKTWAGLGDGTTYVSKDPRKAIGLSFRCYIEGSSYTEPTTYIPMDVSDSFREIMQGYADEGYHTLGGIKKVADPTRMQQLNCEWLAISTHTEGYPSGGSVEYATFAYFNGKELHTGGQLSNVKWRKAQFYRIGRDFTTLQDIQACEPMSLDEIPEELISAIPSKDREIAKGYKDGEIFAVYIPSRYARTPGKVTLLYPNGAFSHLPVVENS